MRYCSDEKRDGEWIQCSEDKPGHRTCRDGKWQPSHRCTGKEEYSASCTLSRDDMTKLLALRGSEPVFFYCCSDCLMCPANAIQIGHAICAIRAAVKKCSPEFTELFVLIMNAAAAAENHEL